MSQKWGQRRQPRNQAHSDVPEQAYYAERTHQSQAPPSPPPTPPPPPLPEEWAAPGDQPRLLGRDDVYRSGDDAKQGLSYVRKTIDATEWEASQEKVANSLYQVLVSGLPNQLLIDSMLNLTLENAFGSDFGAKVHGFKAIKGKSGNGQVLISLADDASARWCEWHFNGRNWGSAVVTAEVVSAPEPEQIPQSLWDQEIPCLPSAPGSWLHQTDAAPFVPASLREEPASGSSWLEQATASLQKEKQVARTHSSSGSSTRDDESDPESAVDFAGVVYSY